MTYHSILYDILRYLFFRFRMYALYSASNDLFSNAWFVAHSVWLSYTFCHHNCK